MQTCRCQGKSNEWPDGNKIAADCGTAGPVDHGDRCPRRTSQAAVRALGSHWGFMLDAWLASNLAMLAETPEPAALEMRGLRGLPCGWPVWLGLGCAGLPSWLLGGGTALRGWRMESGRVGRSPLWTNDVIWAFEDFSRP